MINKLLKNWFDNNFESRISGRYLTLDHLEKLIQDLKNIAKIDSFGISENGVKIPILKIGNGPKKVLAWSQMHGNESTTTKGVFDFLKFLNNKKIYQDEIRSFLNSTTLILIPILNPDGAILNTRENYNSVDLNRDAQNQSQKESVLLRKTFDKFDPDLCLNLHDQRSIFGFENGNAAAISFLAPAADSTCQMTPARNEAVHYINRAVQLLKNEIPNNIGRFDDSFNINCVGDTFTSMNTPTILVEAGHLGNDYSRDISRYYVFLALIGILLDTNKKPINNSAMDDYFNLPENSKNYNDILLRNVKLNSGNIGTVAFQYKEMLDNDIVKLQLVIDTIDVREQRFGHREFDLEGGSILINSQENYHIGQKTESIFDEKHNLSIY